MSVADKINRVKYISEDFQTYRDEAEQFYQTYYPEDFNNLIATDLGNALIDQLAFAMQALSFSMNRRASELFLSTARLTKSITKLSRMLGYPIRPGSPATVDLSLTLPGAPFSFPVTLPIGFQWQGPGDTVYEYRGTLPLVIAPGDTSAIVPIKEGQTKVLSFVSDGTENQQFSIYGVPSGQFLYSDDMVVTVDGVVWDRQGMISYQSENLYEVLFTEDPPKLKFGDGIAGNIPPEGAQIVISFVYGKGASGSIGRNQISGAVQPLVINGQAIELSVTNPVSNVGEDPEDIRHVQAYASTFFRTQNAAVIKADYDTIAQLESGVALADTQIMRGVSGDIVMQGFFAEIEQGKGLILSSANDLIAASVTGVGSVGVSGTGLLGVSGQAGLAVGGVSGLSVSGLSYLGCDVSGNVTGTQYLGIAGIGGLYVGGQAGLGVSGIASVGVSGLEFLGVYGGELILMNAVSGSSLISTGTTGLYDYLSQAFSDTSKANNVQVILLSVDSNNRYIAPSNTTLTNVKAKLDSLKDAVVTISVVSGISKIIETDIYVEMGISQTAVKEDVLLKSQNALYGTSSPYGLLVRRTAGISLYKSDIVEAIMAANEAADVRYINVQILAPASKLDAYGNLIVNSQEIVQNGAIDIQIKKRFLINGEVVDIT